MTTATSEFSLFKQTPTRSLSKTDITTLAARAITDAEAEYQSAKTVRLRAARLASQLPALYSTAEGSRRSSRKSHAPAIIKSSASSAAQQR